MTVEVARAGEDWLTLREPADAVARSADLVDLLVPMLPDEAPLVVHDLGCGTGSMRRWLAPRLHGPQHWIQHDRDGELLTRAAEYQPLQSAAAQVITHEVRQSDITRLDPDELRGASLLTASALLDMFTQDELSRFVETCMRADCPSLITLSVIGRVELTPSDPMDDSVMAAFNDHQRRVTPHGQLLGPDAVHVAIDLFTRLGGEVVARPSPWLLVGGQRSLIAEWFDGWVDAAAEQQPELAATLVPYAQHRLAQAHEGGLTVTVHHLDLLARPQ